MPRKDPTIINPQHLQKRSYDFLDTDHILTKAHAIAYSIQNAEHISTNNINGLAEVLPDDNGQYEMRLIS